MPLVLEAALLEFAPDLGRAGLYGGASMSDALTICPSCHKELILGEWPFCPHGVGSYGAIGDECDIVQENGFRHPTRFTSKIARKRALDAAGLEEHVKWAGPHDKLVSRWASMDQVTLDNAASLVDPARRTERQGPTAPRDDPAGGLNVSWTIRTLE